MPASCDVIRLRLFTRHRWHASVSNKRGEGGHASTNIDARSGHRLETLDALVRSARTVPCVQLTPAGRPLSHHRVRARDRPELARQVAIDGRLWQRCLANEFLGQPLETRCIVSKSFFAQLKEEAEQPPGSQPRSNQHTAQGAWRRGAARQAGASLLRSLCAGAALAQPALPQPQQPLRAPRVRREADAV